MDANIPGKEVALCGGPDLIPPKPLPAQGLFISSISHKDASFSLQYLAPLPSTQPDDRPNGALTARAKIPGQTKASFNISLPTSILVSSAHSPVTSLPVAVSDAVGSPKSHHNLVPFLWDLIERQPITLMLYQLASWHTPGGFD